MFRSDIVINKEYKKVYFIHIPKTSGSTFVHMTSKKPIFHNCQHTFNVNNASRTTHNNRGHKDWTSSTFPKASYPIKEHIKISIVRNPFDLLCSYYHQGVEYRNQPAYTHSGWGAVNYTHRFTSFKQFIQAYCDERFAWHVPLLHKHLFAQLFDENGRCVCDVVIKFEELYKDNTVKQLQKLGVHCNQTTKRNVSTRKQKPYTQYYDQEMIDLVNRKCRKELRDFRYNFHNTADNSPFIYPADITM